MTQPIISTLQQAVIHFSDPKNCIDYMVRMRWVDGKPVCPTCGSEQVAFVPTRMLFQCKGKHAKRQFSVKVGTVLEDSPISLSKWLVVMWLLVNCRNGISSYEVARTIGITQKSAWFMLHRLRVAMEISGCKLSGTVEADETYVGGAIKNKHTKARKQGQYKDKTPVVGIVERGGMVTAMVVPSTQAKVVEPIIEAAVDKKALVITDNFPIYDRLNKMGFTHEVINHTQDRFVRDGIHTNTIENFWSCLKRTLKGTYISVRPHHLNAYVGEQAFRFNVRKGFTEQQRAIVLLNGVQGKRLTYAELVGRA